MTFKLFVDRIEGRRAVLIYDDHGGGEVSLPIEMLPVGSSEGRWLDVSLALDDAATARSHDEISSLYDELGDDP